MKIRFLVSAAVFALLSVACGSAPAPAEAPVKQDLVMGFVPSQTSSIVQTNADLLGSYLSKKTGYNITPRVLTSYPAVTEGMTSNNVDIRWDCPPHYDLAHPINGAHGVTQSLRGRLPKHQALLLLNVK